MPKPSVLASHPFDPKINLMIETARDAGAYLRSVFSDRTACVTAALDHDLKLSADVEVERLIRMKLGSDLPILGEEGGWDTEEPGRRYWIVDGLDGTVNFHYGIPLAAVSIALIADGKPYLGVVYDFHRNELFAGQVGTGATLNELPISVSNASSAESALLLSALATKGDYDPDALARFGVALGKWRKVRMLGTAALSLAYVAAGRADACELLGIMEWDVAAGAAIITAAGGCVSINSRAERHVVDIQAHNGKLSFL